MRILQDTACCFVYITLNSCSFGGQEKRPGRRNADSRLPLSDLPWDSAMSFRYPSFKVYPDKLRAWTDETRIPPGHQMQRPRAMTEVCSFATKSTLGISKESQRHHQSEFDLQPMQMKAPVNLARRKVTKTERVNVVKKCQWDVKENSKDQLVSTHLPRSVITLIGIMFAMSITALLLTLLMLSGGIGPTKHCACVDNKG